MYHRSKMLQYIVNNLSCNFIGVTLYKCNISVSDNKLFVRVGNTLHNITTSTRLELKQNYEGLIAFVRSSLNTGMWVDDITDIVPHSILYSAITDDILPISISIYANTTINSGSLIYNSVFAYTLYPYADTRAKQMISNHLGCVPIHIDRKPTILEQLNAIPLEHKLPWFDSSVEIGHNDLSQLFDGYKFPYELAVTVLEALAVEYSGTRKGEALKIMRSSLDTRNILLMGECNLYMLQILINAVDRRVICIDDIIDRVAKVIPSMCIVLEENKSILPLCMDLHKPIALALSITRNNMFGLEDVLMRNFILDDCKFCARINHEGI